MTLDVHARLTYLVDENFGTRETMPVEKLLDILEREVPALRKRANTMRRRLFLMLAEIDSHDDCEGDNEAYECLEEIRNQAGNVRDLLEAEPETTGPRTCIRGHRWVTRSSSSMGSTSCGPRSSTRRSRTA